ncbi:MAG: DNA gyrase subunit A [Chloroflexota bacterium]
MTTATNTIEAEFNANGATNGNNDGSNNGDNGGTNSGQEADDNSGNIITTSITDEMQTAYLDYAMSVIVSRALPDVRDGLKPVHRRILYAMYADLSLTSDKPHKKSARIVGEVLGKYHPHGDQAVYDAMVRMAQEFSLRYPLIDGQGNFGSIDGDSAAAMRYTEARLDQISDLMLDDLKKDTVDWHENFDSTLKEPDILPAALPNLLINGSNGIAVGMATNIPPHNLSEVVDALAYMIDNFKRVDEITVEDLMQFIKGPDFPTGGILYRFREDKKGDDSTDAIAQGYATGRSRLNLQAKAHFEEMSRNRNRIVVTELPYLTNKTSLIERIASLVRDGKIEGITDLRDESDRTGMRIVIELTRTVDASRILERLFKLTPLQQTFGLQMLALVSGEPIVLGLRRLLRLFIEHRQEIVRRRSEYDLARARERAHIVEGLLRALDILDEVIATIRSSQRVETAKTNLMKNFKFTDVQAQAILDMQLRRLAALERKKLQDEYKELQKLIKYLEDLLASPTKMLKVIKEELLAIQEEYGDVRKTQIVERTKGTLTTTDLLPDQEVWVAVSNEGDLRRQNATKPSSSDAKQAAKGASLAVLNANTQDFLYLFSKDGQCRRVSIHEIPQSGTSKHASLYTEFTRRDSITATCTLSRNSGEDGYLFLVTEQGMVKRLTVADFLKAAPMDPVVMNIEPKDRLRWVLRTTGDQEVILVTTGGQSIRFKEDAVRSMGLAAGGVGGMKLKKDQHIIYAGIVDPGGELLTMTEQGYAKRTTLDQYSTQGRNGGGIATMKPSSRTGDLSTALVIDAETVTTEEEVYLPVILSNGTIRALLVSEIPQMGRSVQGRETVVLDLNSQVVTIHHVQGPQQPLPNGNGNGNGNGGGNGNGNGHGKGGTNGSGKKNGHGNEKANGRSSSGGVAAKGNTQRTQASAGNNGPSARGKTTTRANARTVNATATRAGVTNSRTTNASRTNSTRKSTTRQRASTAKSTTARSTTSKGTGKTTTNPRETKTATTKTSANASTGKGTSQRGTTNTKAARKKTAPKTSVAKTTAPKTRTTKAGETKVASSQKATRRVKADASTERATTKRASAKQATTAKSTRSTRPNSVKTTASQSNRAKTTAKATKSSTTKSSTTKSTPTAGKATVTRTVAKPTARSGTKRSTKNGTTSAESTKATGQSRARKTTVTSKPQTTRSSSSQGRRPKNQQAKTDSAVTVKKKTKADVAKVTEAKAAKPKSTRAKEADAKENTSKTTSAKNKTRRSAKLAAVTTVSAQPKKKEKKKAKK